jgi:cell division topological specificity factor
MSFLDYFKQKKHTGSAAIAKERLQILVAHDRRGGGPSYLPQLQNDLIKVIRKYVTVDNDDVSVRFEQDGAREILEVNIVLPGT